MVNEPETTGIIRDDMGRFLKGVTGNPKGRPVGSVSVIEGIKRKLQEVEPSSQKSYLDLFLSKYFQLAIKEGNEQLMKDMIDRVDGKATQNVNMTVADVSAELDELESNYDELGSKAEEQMVANESSLQD